MGKKTKNENFEQSHSAKILKRGDPVGFFALQFAVKYQKKTIEGKNIEKSRTVPQKS